jgi:hypothetical protein
MKMSLVMLYWRIGQRINLDILKHKRAGYGEEIVAALLLPHSKGFAAAYISLWRLFPLIIQVLQLAQLYS